MCDVAPLLYNTDRVWQCLLTCYMPCYMTCSMNAMKAAEKAVKPGFISRPRRRCRAGGRQCHASAADSLRWPDSVAAGTAEWPPASLQKNNKHSK